jgi:hypothetical protein
MYDSLNDQSTSAPDAEFDEAMLAHALPEVISEEKTLRRVLEDLTDKEIRMVDELQKTIFLSKINLQWNQPTRSFVSVGEISVSSFDKYKLDKKLLGKMEITKKRTGDDFTLYLQSPKGSWYFFKYQKGIMFVIGSDPLFNQYIKDNFEKISKKDEDYKLRPGNIGDRNKFVRIMKQKQ